MVILNNYRLYLKNRQFSFSISNFKIRILQFKQRTFQCLNSKEKSKIHSSRLTKKKKKKERNKRGRENNEREAPRHGYTFKVGKPVCVFLSSLKMPIQMWFMKRA